MGMSLDDAATMAVGSPTIAPPTTTPKSVDDAAAAAVNQGNAATVATVKNNIYNAAATPADTAAANQTLAKQVGAPVESVAANPQPVQQQVAASKVDVTNLMKTAPATTQFLTDPNNAAIAHDDVPNMAATEQALTAPAQGFLGGVENYAGAALRAYGAGQEHLVAKLAAPFLSDQAQQDLIDAGALQPKGGAPISPDASKGVKALHAFSAGLDPLSTAMSLIPAWAIGSAALSPLFEKGIDLAQSEAQKAGLPTANASVVPDVANIAMTLFGAKMLPHIGLHPAEAVNRPTPPMSTPELTAVSQALTPHIEDTAKAMQADAAANRMQQVSDMAAESKLRARDPAAFQAFIKDAAQKAPIQDVYIDAKTFAQLAGGALPEIAKAIPDVGEQLPNAMTAGTDIRIPVDEFTTHLAGTDLAKTLIPHLKTDPDGFSQIEAHEYTTKMGPQIEQDIADALKAKDDNTAFKASSDVVHDNILGQLNDANRFTSDVNRPYAQMASSFYNTMAERAGVTPEELFEKHPLNIRAESAAGGFDQTAPIDLSPSENASPRSVELGKSSVDYSVDAKGVSVDALQTPETARGKGSAREAMEKFLRQTDAAGLKTRLKAEPLDEHTDKEQLHDFYRSLGYKDVPGWADVGELHMERPAAKVGGAVYWHGSPSGDLRGGAYGLHLGTKLAATQALESRIGVPATGEWDGTRSYGETLLAGKDTLARLAKERGYYLDTGHNADVPKGDYYPSEKAKYSDGSFVALDSKPSVSPYRLNSEMTNSPLSPHTDAKANGLMKASVTKGNAKRGFYYKNEGEDEGSISVVVPGPKHVAAALDIFEQDKLGSFNPKTLTISVMKGANLSTFLHESGHFFLHTMTEMANAKDAPEAVKADTQTLMDWFGVKDAAEWQKMPIDEQRPFHEQFARSFEKYLLDGHAPSLELQGVFSRFRSWLLNVYKSAADFLTNNPEAGHMSDEVTSVFNRMLATDEQIGRAESSRNMKPLFATPEEAGMKPDEFNDYAAQSQQATTTATTEMDARRMRDMQYASNARSAAIRDLQREAAGKRSAIREEVTKEVAKEPIYRAENFIRKGELDPEQLKGMNADERRAVVDMGVSKTKLSLPALKEMYGDAANAPWRYLDTGKNGLAGTEGLHPDTLAEMFGFDSGKSLVRELLASEPMRDKINGLTDQRMLERHGDLTDPKSIAAAADRAIHNDVRAKVIATELTALNKQLGNKTLLVKVAKEYAEKVVAQLPANKINPNLYIAAAAKAAKAADAAFKDGDIKEAAEQKRNQLINQYAVKAAFEQKALVDKGLTFMKRFSNNAFREKIAGPYLEQIDGLLSKYDLRKTPTDNPTRAQQNLTKWLDSQRQAGFEPYAPDSIVNGDAMHYGDMFVEQFRGLVDTVRSMKHMSDNLNEVTIAGQKMAVDAAVQELIKPLLERGTKFTKEELLNPPEKHTDSFLAVALHKMGSTLRLVDSDLKPQEFKRNEYDLHELNGPFGRLLFEPMFDRNYWKVGQLKDISTKFGEYGEQLGKEWQKGLYDLVPNVKLLDPDLSTETEPFPMKITRAKMLGIARHVGNESNFDKLTRGYDWKPADVWEFLHENMTEKDWQATQAQWGIFEKYWPDIEGLSRRLGGVPPAKIPLRPFDTKFGRTEGGYAPIDYDPIRSKLSNKFGDIMAEPHEQIGSEPAYRATTTFNGSMENRSAGYTDRVNLDYHGIESRLRDTIHDLAYREALIDANKLITHPDFRSQFMGTFGREEYRGLQTWLRGIRDMNRDESQIKGFEKFLQYARTGVVMTGIAYRLSTVLKHGSSAALKSLGYLGDGEGAKYFAARAARMATGNAQADIVGAQAKFPEIASRMNQMDRDYKVGTQSMYHAEDWRAKNDRFGHAMVAWSDMITAVPTAWAAYDRAIDVGVPESLGGTGKPMTEAQAVAYANKVVREAHGTALEANRSLFLQARGVKGLFGTIYGFMNNTYGQLGDLMDKTVVGGNFQNKPALVARAMATIVAPAMMAAWVSGEFNNKDPWWKQGAKAILGEVAGTVPFVRDAYGMINYGDTSSSGTTAPIRIVGDTVKVAMDAYKGYQGKHSKWVQDTANAMGELFHIGGLGQAGKSLQYLKDVHDGVQNPKSVKDAVTGVTIGPPHK